MDSPFKRPLTWRVGRTLIYAYVLGLAVLIMFAILHGALLHSTLVTLTEIMIVVYLIGVRGYLNSQAARLYYGVRPPGA